MTNTNNSPRRAALKEISKRRDAVYARSIQLREAGADAAEIARLDAEHAELTKAFYAALNALTPEDFS